MTHSGHEVVASSHTHHLFEDIVTLDATDLKSLETIKVSPGMNRVNGTPGLALPVLCNSDLGG